MAGGTANVTSPRINQIPVQTSAYGVTIAAGWGTGLVKPNILDIEDFTSTAVTTTTGGKGGGGVSQTTYNYSATIMMGLCAGTIIGVSSVIIDKKVYTGATALSQVGLSVATGAIGQAVWAYMTGAHPTRARGYSGLAYVYASAYALNDAAGLPNHQFEVQFASHVASLPDANPNAIVPDILTNPLYGVSGWTAGLIDDLTDYGNYCLGANLLLSPVLDQQQSANQFLDSIGNTTNSDMYWSEGLLKIRPRGDTTVTANSTTWVPNLTPVYAIDDGVLMPLSTGGDPIFADISDPSDAPNVVQVEWLDRSNQYNPAIMTANDLANVSLYGERRADVVSKHEVCDPVVAANVTQLLLGRVLYIRKKYYFRLDWSYALLEPTDLLAITDRLNPGITNVLVRITKITDINAPMRCRDIEAEEVPVGPAHAPLYTRQTSTGGLSYPNFAADPGFVEDNLLLYSQDLDNPIWALTNATITANATTAPDGTLTADRIVGTATVARHTISQTAPGVTCAGQPYTLTAYVQFIAGGSTAHGVQLQFGDTTNTNTVQAIFDSSAGTIITAASASGTATGASASIISVGGGWFLATLTGTIPAAVALKTFVGLASTGGATSFNATGFVQAVWGVQLEPGATATPYVRTYANPAVPLIFNPTVSLNGGGIHIYAAAAGGSANWGGCEIWLSTDGTNYSLAEVMTARSRYGFISATLASHTDPDTVDTLSVDLSQSLGTLNSAAHVDADLASTISIVDATEILSYGAVSLTAANRYDLTYLRRGQLNTVIAAHTPGAYFIRMDDSVATFPYHAANIGQLYYAKFRSFNNLGAGSPQSLAVCAPYQFIPYPIGSRPPSTTAWTAVGTQFNQGGQSIPAIVITGASDNRSADGVVFFYRVTGTTAWAAQGSDTPQITRKEITSVTPTTQYDVAVAYTVRGVLGTLYLIGTVTTGALSGATGGGSGSGTLAAGTQILATSTPGSAVVFTVPSNCTTHVDVELWGCGGDGNFTISGGGGGGGKGGGGTRTDYGGGAGGYCKMAGVVVTPGTSTFTYTLRVHGAGTASTCTSTAFAGTMTSNAGTSATTSAVGTGGSATGPGGATTTTGHAGGLVDLWDGGGTAPAFADQTTDGSGGTTPGGGGSGSYFDSGSSSYIVAPGANAMIVITAR